MYSSTTTTQATSRQGGYTKGYAPQVPQGFTVRVFKSPSVYSFPQTTQSHFDRGYQSIPLSEPRQSSNFLNWYTGAQTTTLAPGDSQKASRPPSSGTSLPNDPGLLTYDPSSRSKPSSYSIYQSTNDTFIYEASLSSKADLSSNSEDGDYNSVFSPAMSTDSIMTVRGANTPDASMTDLQTSTPAPASTPSSSRISFPLNIPSLAQAQTAIKGIFRSQAQNDSQSTANLNTSLSASSSGTSSRPSVAKPSRVLETASRSGDRDSAITKRHNEHASSAENVLLGPRSPISDDEDGDVDPIAKANAEYNAAVSKAGSSVSYYSSTRESVHPSVATSTATGAGVRSATGPLHPNPNLAIRSGLEQYHTQATTQYAQPSYWSALEMTGPQNMANGHKNQFPSVDPLASTAQIPLSQSSGPSSRYVPASQTMTPGPLSNSPEPTANRERHESSTYVLPSVARERKTSVSHVSPPITVQVAAHREGGGASASRSAPSADESRRGSSGRQVPPYAPYRADPPASQEPSTFIESHQAYNAPSTHHATATIQSNRNVVPETNPWYMASTATRTSGSVISHTSDRRTSPEHMYPSQQPNPQPRNHTTAPPSGERASNYVNSASTRGTSTSPPRTRHDSTVSFTNGLSTRPSNVETSPTLTPAQGRPQQDMRTRQSSIYGPQTFRIDDARNPRGREYSFETEDSYSRTSKRQASHVLNAYPQRGPATTVTSSSSSARGRPETPAVSDPSQIPFPAPVREPQRRYSDGDSSVAGQSIYGPAYASTLGANVLSGVTSTATKAPKMTEPQPRRNSDGESNVQDRASLTLFRTVRWNENLICPSPIFPHQRRKGWFNRRGDQLWTNDGAYKPPAQGQEYPPDLDGYPEHGDGWMNEQGVRIDTAHRLIPKVPLKSALKTSRPQPTTVQQGN